MERRRKRMGTVYENGQECKKPVSPRGGVKKKMAKGVAVFRKSFCDRFGEQPAGPFVQEIRRLIDGFINGLQSPGRSQLEYVPTLINTPKTNEEIGAETDRRMEIVQHEIDVLSANLGESTLKEGTRALDGAAEAWNKKKVRFQIDEKEYQEKMKRMQKRKERIEIERKIRENIAKAKQEEERKEKIRKEELQKREEERRRLREKEREQKKRKEQKNGKRKESKDQGENEQEEKQKKDEEQKEINRYKQKIKQTMKEKEMANKLKQRGYKIPKIKEKDESFTLGRLKVQGIIPKKAVMEVIMGEQDEDGYSSIKIIRCQPKL